MDESKVDAFEAALDRVRVSPSARDALRRAKDLVVVERLSMAHDETRPLESEQTLLRIDNPDATSAPVASEKSIVPGLLHLQDHGRLAMGGMGELRRVRDLRFSRGIVLKVLRRKLMAKPHDVSRFIEEAQVTAQLQHPAIVPVHEYGRLRDGRPYFTMKHVRGHTLEAIIHELHRDSSPRHWGTTTDGLGFDQVLGGMQKVCEAVAYAHSRGVLHRDIKPANIMMGAFGETYMMDWGLAKVVGQPEPAHRAAPKVEPEAPVHSSRSGSGVHATKAGSIAGTLAFMAPELARLGASLANPRTDVYALGATLYEVLAGTKPYDGETWEDVCLKLLDGPPTGLGSDELHRLPPIPQELVEICQRAMHRDPKERFAGAQELAQELARFLASARRRREALRILERARAKLPFIEGLRQAADAVGAQAKALALPIPTHAPIALKRPAWSLEEAADRQRHEAELEEIHMLSLAHGALNHDPTLAEGRQLLADHYAAKHRQAEADLQPDEAAKWEALLRAQRVPSYRSYLRGTGTLSLLTDPPGATVDLYSYRSQDRTLVPTFQRTLGVTPLNEVELPIGSYELRIRCPGCVDTVYPVFIRREQHWDGVPPEKSAPLPIRLLRPHELGPNEVYVPAGWTLNGQHFVSINAHPTRWIWVDGMVVSTLPVTVREFADFLDALQHAGQVDEAHAMASNPYAPLLAPDLSGVHQRQPDSQDQLPDWSWPLSCASLSQATRYAAWRASRDGLPIRLLNQSEWEKAARGVDGRAYPWGDQADPTFANVRGSSTEIRLQPVGHYPTDRSVYGCRDMVGNVQELTCSYGLPGKPAADYNGRLLDTTPQRDNPHIVAKGGCYAAIIGHSMVFVRFVFAEDSAVPWLGFRVGRSIEDT